MIDSAPFRAASPGGWRQPPDWLGTPVSMLDAIGRYGDDVAIEHEGRTWSYAELARTATEVADAWRRAGVAPGDALAVYLPNSVGWAVAQLAAGACGAVVVPVNVRARPAEIASLLQQTRPALLVLCERFLTNPLLDRAREARTLVEPEVFPSRIVVLDDPFESRGLLDVEPSRAVTGGPRVAPGVATSEAGTPYVAFWTSGTTGRPKSVVHAWESLAATVWNWTSMLGFGDPDTVIVATRPFYYIAGNAFQLLGTLLHGGRLVLVPGLEPSALYAAMREQNASHLLGGPHLHGQIIEAGRGRPALTSLRCVTVGGDPPPSDLVARLMGELGADTVVQTYGMTEVQGFVTTMFPGEARPGLELDAGMCLPGVRIRIVDESGIEVPDGETGQIEVGGRSPWGHFARGRLRPAERGAGGFLSSGDLGRIDRGRLSVVGRLTGLLKVSGERVHVDDVEATMRVWPELTEVMAFPVDDPERVHVVGVAVELAPSAHGLIADLTTLVRRAAAELSPPKRPKLITILPTGWTWPRNVAGKLRRREVEAALAADSGLTTVDLRDPRWAQHLERTTSTTGTVA